MTIQQPVYRLDQCDICGRYINRTRDVVCLVVKPQIDNIIITIRHDYCDFAAGQLAAAARILDDDPHKPS